tara:strand:+ start:47318 stop:47482 length:165 start_codon:yes stop_codon:yes gene_type:complete
MSLESKYYYVMDEDGILMASGTLTGDYSHMSYTTINKEEYELVQCNDTDNIFLI